MTKEFSCTSVEKLMNELLSWHRHGEGLEKDSSEDTFLEIIQLNAYDGDNRTNKPAATAEIICGEDTGVPYCMCIAKGYDTANNDGGPVKETFDFVFDTVLKDLANSHNIKSNSG